MERPAAKAALVTFATAILTGGALALAATPAAAEQEDTKATPGLVVLDGDDFPVPVPIYPSNPSGN